VYALNVLNRFAGFGFDFNLQVDNLKLSAPLILSLFVSGSSEYIDGLIVKAKFNDMFFALFRYGAKELPILLIMANTFSAAMITPIAANLQNGLKEMKDRSAKLMHIFFPVSLALMLFSPVIYRYVFGENFVYSSIIFNVYLLLAIPRVLFPQTILTGMQQTRYLLVSSLLEIVINVSLSVYLAGKIGLPGIAAGTFIAYTFDKLFLMTVAYWVYGIKPSAYIRLAPFFIYSVALLVAFGVSQYLFKIQFWGF
ncbi:MAG: polysaccharide biosynthesis C-terminal domain-containing protein, partial [Chitinophagales bacterium]|nr:polysaccharide biosynthesis C-terminal domain-containing protein [Chitinophagales bacterium]